MIKIEAEAIITEYRALHKTRTIAVPEFANGDSGAIGTKFREGEGDLVSIAICIQS